MESRHISLNEDSTLVGETFAKNYYRVLQEKPEEGFKFYGEDSKLCRPTSTGETVTVSGLEAINKMLLSLAENWSKLVIDTIDSQVSYNNGVLVQVTGSVGIKNNISKKFFQCFYLARLESGYVIANDVFRDLDAQEQHIAVAPEAPPVRQDEPKISYVSALEEKKEIALHKPCTVVDVPVLSAEGQPKASSTESAIVTDNRKEFSIHVRNLPYNVTPDQLEKVFKKFGEIKPSGVQVRSQVGKFSYGFVHFQTETSVERALEASPIMIGGRRAFVDHKRPTDGTKIISTTERLP